MNENYVFTKPYADLDFQTKKRNNGKRYITHNPYTNEKIRRKDQITMKQFRRNPFGKPQLDPNIDFSSVYEMLGLGDAMGTGGNSAALGRQGTLSSALFGRAPKITRFS